MMDVLEKILGLNLEPRNLDTLQISVRSVIVFIAALITVRVAPKRFLGQKTAFDFLLAFVLGSMLSRAINGSAAFFPTLVGGVVLVLIHRVLAMLAFRFRKFETLVKGANEILIEDGQLRKEALRKHCLTDADLLEDLRLKSYESPADVKCARLEASGELSVIAKKPKS